jgi:signal peptidase I
MSARQSVGDRPARARGKKLPEPPPELEEGVAREAWLLAARMQYEMLAEANEEAERVLREAEQARVALLRSAADLQAEAATEVERAREARAAAERARGEADAEAAAVLEDAARRAERVRTKAEDDAARVRAEVETEAMARRAELEQELESARADAAERQRVFLSELEADRTRLERTATEQREAMLARARAEAEQQRRVVLDEAAMRVERVLAEANAAADQRRASAEREASEVLRAANDGVDQLQAEVIEEGRQEVGRLLARGSAERDELMRAAEAEAARIIGEAEQVATVLRSEAARAYASQVQPRPAPPAAAAAAPERVTMVPASGAAPDPAPAAPPHPAPAESAPTGPTRIVTTAGPVPVPGASGATSAPPSMVPTPSRPRRLSAERVRQARARLAGGPATGRTKDDEKSGDGGERSAADDDRPSPAGPLASITALPGSLLTFATAPVRLVRPARRRFREVLADRPRLRVATHVAAFVVPAFVVAVLVKLFVAQAYYIPSTSMQPQLDVGDRVLVSRLSYRLHEPRRGDVVVFDEPGAEGDQGVLPMRVARSALGALGVGTGGDTLVKRVVALPGEVVEGREGRVFVDGRELREPYLAREEVTSAFGPERVPQDHLWVLGDSRRNSVDSRTFGPVPVDDLEGRAVLRVWPPQRSAFL